MANVRFYSGTKEQYLNLASHNPLALYFCDDTGELYKGDICLTDGIRIVPTRADLPECLCAADGVVYFIAETKSGYMVSPDRTEWLQTIYAPVTDAYSIPESEIYNTVTTVGAVRDIEEKIYKRIEEIATSGLSTLTAVDGTIKIADTEDGGKSIGVVIAPKDGNALIAVDGGLFVPAASVKLADNTHGLVAVDGALTLNLATKDSDGAMSKEDKRVLDAVPYVYVARKYEISNKPDGTLVDYRDKEIRIMCPVDTEWKHQNSGEGADTNNYYIGFKAYAPDGAVSFKEDLAEIIADDTMYYFEGNDFAGTDAYGRKYSIVWLPVAYNDNDTWTYYGTTSTVSKYIGWYYTVQWYNDNGRMIGADQIRINLSNENCYISAAPSYMNEIITAAEAEEIKTTVAAMEESYSWGEMF